MLMYSKLCKFDNCVFSGSHIVCPLQAETAMSGYNEQVEICSQSLHEGPSVRPDRVHGEQRESSVGPQPSPSLRENCLVPSALP